ncbi:pancreatic triacylglycerol lipase isoform X2 [Solenopsis invicta]|uniref:pancreatic triacylglycerol lipase isoform X2 n=1 Tax=Solenopsis invicta TaxID=13686 RepID=UPI00193DEDC0|nr:pancreatic triacylglycerol lipase isoform X2 [Solenopsis invicta]
MLIHVFRQFVFTIIYVTAIGCVINNEKLESIFLRIYIGTTMNEYIDYPLENASAITSQINNNKPTVLYIHGFTENLKKTSVRTVVEAYLERNDHNIIGLDYRDIASDNYVKVAENIPHVGDVVASTLEEMVKSGFDMEKFHIVGHSMGGQVAGYIGRKIKYQIPRITDARFVDIIHTDQGFYGVAKDTAGTVDFFPNGGSRVQPGCPRLKLPVIDDKDFCSHHRSWRFYAESVINESAFLGVQCSTLSDFKYDKCSNNTRIVMGYATPTSARGTVYLVTAAQSPFGLKKKGTDCSTLTFAECIALL